MQHSEDQSTDAARDGREVGRQPGSLEAAGRAGGIASSKIEFQGLQDNWAGTTDPKRRRRLQNLLNQRAYRRRRREQNVAGAQTSQGPEQSIQPRKLPPNRWNYWTPCRIVLPENHGISEKWEARLLQEFMTGSPSVMNLSVVTGLNVFKALSANNKALGFGEEWLQYEAVSPFNFDGPRSNTTDQQLQALPPNLRPTSLQRSVRHHPWIDLFPIPKMRDNILTAYDIFDEDQLCLDLLAVDLGIDENSHGAGASTSAVAPTTRPGERPVLLIWGDPADPTMWEATEAFVKKWSWILEGCDDILRATNQWREKRGDEKLLAHPDS